jgi:hypothetical protein
LNIQKNQTALHGSCFAVRLAAEEKNDSESNEQPRRVCGEINTPEDIGYEAAHLARMWLPSATRRLAGRTPSASPVKAAIPVRDGHFPMTDCSHRHHGDQQRLLFECVGTELHL